MLFVITLIGILLISIFGGYAKRPHDVHPTISQNENVLTVCVYIPRGSILLFHGWYDEELSTFVKNENGDWVFKDRIKKEYYYALFWGKEPKIVKETVERRT